MYLLMTLVFALGALCLFILAKVKGSDDFDTEFKFYGAAWSVTAAFVITLVLWGMTYCDRWDDQRRVEAFVQSELYVKYAEIITASSEFEIVKLQAVGINVQDLMNRIARANEIITAHNAGNKSFWFDVGYPDWDPPKIITLK